MFISLMKKMDVLASIFLVLFVFGLIIFSSHIEIKDMDLWLHLASGRYILDHFSVPKTDIFSAAFTGKTWINHEWLFQVLVAYLWGLFGPNGVISLQVVLVFSTFFLLFLLGFDRKKIFINSTVLLLAALVFQIRFTHRPDLFSLLFLAIYLFLLQSDIKHKVIPWIFFSLQVLWVNIHGFFIWGPIIIFLEIISQGLKRTGKLPFGWNDVNRMDRGSYRQLFGILFLTLIANVFNPHFLYGAYYPLKVMFSLSGTSKMIFDFIVELQPPLTWHTIFALTPYPFYRLLILVTFASFFVDYKKIDIRNLFLWIIFFVFSLKALRNLAFFAVVSYVVFVINIKNLWEGFFRKTILSKDSVKVSVSIALKVLVILWIAGYISRQALRGYYDLDHLERKSEYGGVSLRNFPYKAATFLKATGVKGRFFNNFNSGAYLLGKTFPNIKVFVDGRTEFYGPKYLQRYQDIMKGSTFLFQEVLNQYNLTGVFLSYVYIPAPEPLMRYLYQSPEWKLVYFDYDASIFLKDVAENKELIKKYAIDIDGWVPAQEDLLKYGSDSFTPYRHYNRAAALYNFGFLDKAIEEMKQGLRINPYYPEGYNLLSLIYAEKRDFKNVFDYARMAKLGNAYDPEYRYYLGLAYLELGYMDQAREECQKLLALDPSGNKGFFLRAQIYAKEKKFDRLFSFLGGKKDINIIHVKYLNRIGETLYQQKDFLQAERVYSMILGFDKANREANERLRQIRQQLKGGAVAQ